MLKASFPEFQLPPRDALAAAVKKMGLASLKDKQVEAILSFVGGKDVFVSLPTGYGKSIIYAILPQVYDELLGECSYRFIFLSGIAVTMLSLTLLQVLLDT